jgi:glycosyltransferase involved in cell wall biosynthesis
MDHTSTVFAVVVAFRREWQAIASASFLLTSLREPPPTPSGGTRFKLTRVLVYDNSPQPLAMPAKNIADVCYVHDANNGGTRAAYLRAVQQAANEGQDWILILDQDTDLPEDFFSRSANMALGDSDVLLSRIEHGGRPVSPARVTRSGSIVPFHPAPGPVNIKNVTAIASGVLIRTRVLHRVPTPPKELWLDYLDHWIFLQLNNSGSRIAVTDTTLEHDLSIMDIASVSPQRLRSIWSAERIFVTNLPMTARAYYRWRLAYRFLRLLVVHRPAAYELVRWLLRTRTAA